MKTNMKEARNGRINIILKDQRQLINRNNREQGEESQSHYFQTIDDTFSSFIGLEDIKRTLKQIYATNIINDKRKSLGITTSKQVLHMLFMGNPGTGKTTVARKLATFFTEIGVLSKGHLIEAERADLVGEYIGQTAQKTRAMIDKALGGILFIDEAYSLARGGEKDFGKEAIDTLVKHMEDYQNDFVLILAGYRKEMQQFLKLNPGMHSRFPFVLDFPNYSLEQLIQIAQKMLSEREYTLTKDAELKLKMQLAKTIDAYDTNFSNAREVRNIIENAIRNHAFRLLREQADYTKATILTTLTTEDL